MRHTIVQYYGEQNRSRCGYCRNTNTSNSHGMHAYVMSTTDYQDLIDRGWRRSGDYCYKPDNSSTCCPCYTIRCDTHEFKLSKSQKKILKRFNRFLQNGIKDKDGQSAECDPSGEHDSEANVGDGLSSQEPDIPKVTLQDIDVNAVKEKFLGTPSSSIASEKAVGVDANQIRAAQADKRRDEATSSDSAETVRPPCKKAKQMRLERKQAKLAAKGIQDGVKPQKSTGNQEKSLSDFMEEVHESPRHKLTVKIVPSNKGVTKSVLELYRKYQCTVHKDPPQKITQKSYERFLVRTPLQMKLVEVHSQEFKDTLSKSYGLYKKYQTVVHNDPPEGRDDYLCFLQNSPLQYMKTADGPEQGYGSFHQQYWLDGRLIAVGVIDILPYCVSSVYFFYDPDYNFLSLGTYGSLREVYLTQQLSKRTPALKYYYMGFYIHSCPKMVYKGRLSGSYLLCPEVYSWHLLTDAIRKELDESNYQRLNSDLEAKDVNYFHEEDVDAVLILYNQNSFMTYRNYMQAVTGPDQTRADLLEYGKFVGRQCAHRMLYVKV